MAVDVILEVAAGSKANVAEVAGVWLLTCVSPLVHQKIRNAVEKTAADAGLGAGKSLWMRFYITND